MADLTPNRIPVATGATVLSDGPLTVAGVTVRLTGVAFAGLPAAALGMMAVITDSSTATWGATIAGGGTNRVLAFHNGTNWTVMAA
jgi:hypothetical protein